MSIDFRCPQCDKLLRVPDDSAGKQAKCPQCSAILRVPMSGAMSEPQAPLMAQSVAGSGARGVTDSANPFSAPQTVNVSSGMSEYGDDSERNGPPWEQRSSSATYVETLKLVAMQPALMFSTMRTTGGIGKPLSYCFVGFVVAVIVTAIYQAFLFADVGGGRLGAGGTVGILIGLAIGLSLGFLLFIVGALIAAGLFHLALMMVGGANRGYEATFRVLIYTYGTTVYAELIPYVGGLIGLICNLVLYSIGLARAHETSLGKAVAAVAMVFLFFVALIVGLVIMIGDTMLDALKQAYGWG